MKSTGSGGINAYSEPVAGENDLAQDPFDLLHARLAWTPRSERFELAAFGTNLGDEEYLQQGIFIFGFGPALGVPGRPREWGVSAKWRF